MKHLRLCSLVCVLTLAACASNPAPPAAPSPVYPTMPPSKQPAPAQPYSQKWRPLVAQWQTLLAKAQQLQMAITQMTQKKPLDGPEALQASED